MRARRILPLAAVLLAGVPAAAGARTITVSTTSDTAAHQQCPATPEAPCTLREALATSDNELGGDTIVLPRGVTSLTSALHAYYPVTITGQGSAGETVVDANGHAGVFGFDTQLGRQAFTLAHLTIQKSVGASAITTSNVEPLTLNDVIVRGNRVLVPGKGGSDPSGSGGGLTVESGTVSIVDSVFTDNAAGFAGGAIYMLGGELTMRDSELRGNATSNSGGGGAIALDNASSAVIQRSRLSGNTARRGAAVATLGGPKFLSITDSTLDGNTATDRGGAIDIADGPALTTTVVAYGDTFVDNSAPAGAGLGGALARLALRNSVLARNHGGDCAAVLPLASAGHNVADDGSCGLHGAGDRQSIDPKLGTVTDNGGPTSTAMPLSGSPLLDAADAKSCSPTDQRGIARSQGPGCDVGAVERVLDPRTGAEVGPATTPAPGATTLPAPAPQAFVSKLGLAHHIVRTQAVLTWMATQAGSVRFAVKVKHGTHWVTKTHFSLKSTAGHNRGPIPRTTLERLHAGSYRIEAPSGSRTSFVYAPPATKGKR